MSERGGELWEKEKAAKVNESRCVRSGKRRGGSERARGVEPLRTPRVTCISL